MRVPTQIDETANTNWVLARALSDPTAPLGEQAAAVASLRGNEVSDPPTEYGMMQDGLDVPLQSLSVNYRAPARVARLLRAQQLTLGGAGGKPGAAQHLPGERPQREQLEPERETIRDTGQMPQPRTWQVRLDLHY